MNCIKINYTCYILGRVPLAVPSVSFHCYARKSTLIFSYQLYAIILDLPKMEVHLCQENQAIWMSENIFAFDEEGWLPCARGERDSKKYSYSQKLV